MPTPASCVHPRISRRGLIQAGRIGILGLGLNHIEQLHAAQAATNRPPARNVIYIFLSGGLAQHESFDMKPAAPAEIRGEFHPISTRTPGIQICEHLPLLAARSNRWALLRSLGHPYNEHSEGHMVMLSGSHSAADRLQRVGTPTRRPPLDGRYRRPIARWPQQPAAGDRAP